MYKCIVVGFDGSHASRLALDRAVELAKKFGSKIHVITVASVYPVTAGFVPETLPSEILDEARKLVSYALDHLKNAGVNDAEGSVRVGSPVGEIIRFAEEVGADLIIVGRTGKGLLDRMLIGSTSMGVVQRSTHIDVLVVPFKE